eukprot:Partr_v1_DN28300_c2_g2_i1_m75883 putative Ribosome maturation protein
MSLFQPSGQIKLTNVSIVRLKKGGKRFEIACYKNKAVEWRSGVELDLDNVLQIQSVFMNVSKGQVASLDDLEKCFKTREMDKIILEILKKGELQVSTLERNSQISSMHKDIIQIITEKTVHPGTKRPYPATMIEKAVAEVHYSVNTAKSAKQQAMEIIRLLQERNTIPISRAQMKVHIQMPAKEAKRLKEKMMASIAKVEFENYRQNDFEMECLIDPGQFRVLTELIQNDSKSQARIDVLSLSETVDGDERIE